MLPTRVKGVRAVRNHGSSTSLPDESEPLGFVAMFVLHLGTFLSLPGLLHCQPATRVAGSLQPFEAQSACISKNTKLCQQSWESP